MSIEMNKLPPVRLTPVQEIKLTKPATELYVGQIIKSVVVTTLSNDQVMININGQHLNAKSSHYFAPGDLLELKVIANQGETVFEIQEHNSSLSTLQSALLQALPKQAPAINLLNNLNQLKDSSKIPVSTQLQIKAILSGITPLSQLPQQIMQAIYHSGMLFESILLKEQGIKSDFKAQCLKLLQSLSGTTHDKTSVPSDLESQLLQKDPLPLPGAIPQPLSKNAILSLLDQSPEFIQHILRDQITQVLARITAHQINHLTHGNKEGYLIMLDLPVQLVDAIDVIPLMIQQHKAEPMQASRWSISFALSLKNLGNLQGTVGISAKNVDFKLNAQKDATLKTLAGYEFEIKEILHSLGLKLGDFKLQLGLENNHIDTEKLHLLDIRI